jgi:hypothetical protein
MAFYGCFFSTGSPSRLANVLQVSTYKQIKILKPPWDTLRGDKLILFLSLFRFFNNSE